MCEPPLSTRDKDASFVNEVLLFVFIPGIDVNLFYVRDGVTNEYALRFPVPVPGNMSELEFSWKNLRPQHQTLNYKIEIQLDNPHAMFQPTLNIPSKGSQMINKMAILF